MSLPQIAFVGLTGAMLLVAGRGRVAYPLAMRSIGYTAAQAAVVRRGRP